jgi:hypothetical protein
VGCFLAAMLPARAQLKTEPLRGGLTRPPWSLAAIPAGAFQTDKRSRSLVNAKVGALRMMTHGSFARCP